VSFLQPKEVLFGLCRDNLSNTLYKVRNKKITFFHSATIVFVCNFVEKMCVLFLTFISHFHTFKLRFVKFEFIVFLLNRLVTMSTFLVMVLVILK